MRYVLPALLALAPILSGCVAAAAAVVGVGVGVGVVQYNRNEVEQDFPIDLADAWKGTLEGLGHVGIAPSECVLGPTEGRIEHDDLVVLVERHPEGFTRVRVRAGTFCSSDHLRRAQILLQEIGAALERQNELRAWAEKVQGRQSPAPSGQTPPAADPKPESKSESKPEQKRGP